VTGGAALQISGCNRSKVGVGKGYHFLESFPIAFLPTVQKLGDLVRNRRFGRHALLILLLMIFIGKLILPR
jgi:hypothetical protein